MTDGAATQYGFPQYDAPRARGVATARVQGWERTRDGGADAPGRDGADAYEAIANTAYLKQAAANAMKYGWEKSKQTPGVRKYMK